MITESNLDSKLRGSIIKKKFYVEVFSWKPTFHFGMLPVLYSIYDIYRSLLVDGILLYLFSMVFHA